MPIKRNGFGNCQSDLIGSGRFFCDTKTLGNLTGVILHAKGTGRYPETGDLKALLQADIKALKAFPYTGLNGFENSHEENQMNTSSLGIMSVARVGLPAFTFTYTEGSQQHKSLYNKMGNGRWDYTLLFEKGMLRASSTDGITSEPLTGTTVSVANLALLNGTDLENSNVMIQLASAIQYNERNEFLNYADNEISLEGDLEGVIETRIRFTETPSAGDTVTIAITSAGNSDSNIDMFDEGDNYKVTVLAANGTPVPTTAVPAVNTDTGEILLTLTPAIVSGQKIRVSLTSTVSSVVYPVAVDADGKYFKGSTPLTTVVA